MSRRKASQAGATQHDPATENLRQGETIIAQHPLFSPLWRRAHVIRDKQRTRCPEHGWAVVDSNGTIHVHPARRGAPEEWAYVLAHCLLHLGFGHFRKPDQLEVDPRRWNDACDLFLATFLRQLKIGCPPLEMQAPDDDSFGADEQRIYTALGRRALPLHWQGCGAAGPGSPDMLFAAIPTRSRYRYGKPTDWPELLAVGLTQAVTNAVLVAGGELPSLNSETAIHTTAQRAREWFINSYPLLGALASAFKIVEDPLICQREGVSVAAVDPQSREIFINPLAGLDAQECRFVMAHELLHVGLRHDARQQGRDPYLWNVAADYVINGWLVEMNVGTMPEIGGLYDATLQGESAEAIYDRIVTDLRRYRRLRTMRGVGVSDILKRGLPDWRELGPGVDLDAFYRSCLAQGLEYHSSAERGLLPAGLIEEIQALSQPPIPWDVELARWFDDRFPPIERVSAYARPSRRQSSTPDIPRPRWVLPPDWAKGRTFGVILDTSGSMSRATLARALGAIASYSLARDVPVARVVFCDAATYDQGYLRPEDIAGLVKVRGRGGTVLQPAIDLLEDAEDFPPEGPILLITDGYCDRLHVPGRREHAYLLPWGRSLPFIPRGPVFRIKE
ncbi:MAG: peptidase [Ktedonobacterales bacterium]